MAVANLALRGANIVDWLSASGRVFTAADADQNDAVTGQTSFAATTPTFLIDVPSGTVIVPLEVALHQTGTVAGGVISVIIEKDNADRYNTGGTTETVYNDFSRTNVCVVRSNATANAGYGIRLAAFEVAQDVTPTGAEHGSREILWTPGRALSYIKGPGAFAVYTWAAITGPSWLWSISWAELNDEDF